MNQKKIKVLIVDDSLVNQKLYRKLLSEVEQFQLVGFATNGREAIKKVEQLKPDVVSMDINMPLMNGLEATRKIMETTPIPVLIVSSLYTNDEAEMAMKVLEAGAVNIIAKPRGPGNPKHESDAKNFRNMLKYMSEIKVVRRRSDYIMSNSYSSQNAKTDFSDFEIVLIGASAGGPEGVKTILSNIDRNFKLPIIVVQHIDSHFSDGYCNWLNSFSTLPVVMATENLEIIPGRIILAPGDFHTIIKSKGIVTLERGTALKGHKPAIARLFETAATVYKSKNIAILLSGMGTDGAQEMKHLKDKGSFTIAQSKESCLVFGMPGEAAKLDAVKEFLNPTEIVNKLNAINSTLWKP